MKEYAHNGKEVTGGPGSRQPSLKLPQLMPDGRKTKMHPFLWMLKRYLDDKAHEGATKTKVATALGIKPQSLYKWEKACKNDRNFPLPVLRAKQLGEYFNVPPALLRPDAFKD